MRLSIISLVSETPKDVDSFLRALTLQEKQDFEVILCINKKSKSKQIFDVIQKYQNFFKNRIIVLFNSKTKSYQFNLLKAFGVLSGDYACVINSDGPLKRHYIDRLIEQIELHNADVIELKPRIIGSVLWKPQARFKTDEIVHITSNKYALTYSFPFIFNKIFKRTLVQKILNYQSISKSDSKLCVEINYILMLSASTYIYIDQRILKEYYGANILLSTKNEIKSFKQIRSFAQEKQLNLELELIYAQFYYLKIIMYGLLNATTFAYRNFKSKEQIQQTRSSLIVQKHEQELTKLENSTEFKEFEKENTYMLKSSIETQMLKTSIRKLKQIKTKILSELE
ncbi:MULTISPECIES: glycosyltransferase [unclassified Mycoplasma]|uniref:glycosyltransferase n=1 Tax=unclassified Mycoplasma TaxID=2683645 RepID=UPI00211B86B8|nr:MULTISPECIES: glycosyltransferase [unclassified Mycoplasma]UUM19588.1 glycosyltransferase [Mycoplasma sp. 1578d]UUM24508.1 glycosyltransferase [Mycoplasma sp. 3686d]